MSGEPKGRRLETPAGGKTLFAQRQNGLYRIVDPQGEIIGYMRSVLQQRWAISLTAEGPYQGTYADMPHAAQGILFRRREGQA